MTTRNASLWLLNDEGLYNEAQSIARHSHSLRQCAQAFEEAFADALVVVVPDNVDLDDIDWEEVAENFYEEPKVSTFTLNINTDNAVFEDGDELGRILRKLANKVEDITPGATGKIMDINGNAVGTWEAN